MTVTGLQLIETPYGRFVVRPDTNDGALVGGILGLGGEPEYPFDRLRNLRGIAVDLGAHIGIVTVALARMNPDLSIIAVEALEENAEVLRENLAINDLTGRVAVLVRAAGTDAPTPVIYDYERAGDEPAGYVHESRYIGNIYHDPNMDMVAKTRLVPGISLTSLLADIDDVAFLKSDTEGAEWTYLRDPAMDKVAIACGEWHGDPGLEGVRELLHHHDVMQLDDNPVNGIFWAVRR